MKLTARCFAVLVLMVLALPQVEAAEVLNGVKSRGQLRCGVSEDIPGFSERDANGQWRGLEVDFCRAVAAAVLNDPEKVDFVPLLRPAHGFPRCRRAGSTCCWPTPRGPSPARPY
jgi:general L-amino acid transport system substrate-binding protein